MKTTMIILRALLFALFGTLLPALVIAFYLADVDIAFGLSLFQSVPALLTGISLAVIGLVFRIWATVTFYRHRLAVLRFTAQNKLISSGPYRFTRSPHYIGITLMFFGSAFIVGSYVALMASVLLVVFWKQLLSRYEEPKLEQSFGKEYELYRNTVPRWFSWQKNSLVALALIIIVSLGTFGISAGMCPSEQPNVAENQITVNGMNVFYQTAGASNSRPLIFLHGWGAHHNDTCGIGRKEVTAQLAQHYRVFAVELPGLIRSNPPKDVWDMEEYAEFLHSFFGEIGIENPIIMGQSFGGGVATTYAGLYTDNVPQLVLVDASPSGLTPNFYYSLRFKWQPIFDWIVENEIVPLSFKRTVMSLYLGVPHAQISRQNAADYLIMSEVETRYKVKTDYSSLPMPVLLVWGEKDTYVTPLKRAKEIAEEIPNAKLVVVPSAGHLALYTNTELVVKEIVNFLSR